MLDQPEYVHVVTNHLPLIGLLVAMLALVGALATKDRTATLIGMLLVCLLALSAWPVYHYGEEGYDRVLSMSDEAGGKFLDHHKALAERWVFLYFVTASVAGLGFILVWKWPRTLVASSLLVLVLAAASLAAGMVIAKSGGAVRHREFRSALPPTDTRPTGNQDLAQRRRGSQAWLCWGPWTGLQYFLGFAVQAPYAGARKS